MLTSSLQTRIRIQGLFFHPAQDLPGSLSGLACQRLDSFGYDKRFDLVGLPWLPP